MATKIPTEILIKILNNFQSTRDLHSSLLVNRIWCKVAIPMLWELTLCQEFLWWKKALCIRTYISCMDTQARTLLIENGFDLSSSPPQAIFDYPSFTHKIIIDNLFYFISIYSPQISPPQINHNNYNNEIAMIKSRILFREICRLIINHCSFLDYFKLAVLDDFNSFPRNNSYLIDSILVLTGAPKVFRKLKSFTSMIGDHKSIYPLYESLSLICKNILKMDLNLFSNSQAQLLAKLISAQKRLENLSIVTSDLHNLPDSIFWAIISQRVTLKSLRLYLNFCHFKGKASPFGQFISLQELYIKGWYGSNCLLLASSFTQLSTFHYFQSSHRYPHEFIIKILETANMNLKDICLNLYSTITFDIFSAILNYCTNITELTLHSLSPELVIAIFNNNFNELRRLSFDCGWNWLIADELLLQMAKNIPESLETIEISRCDFISDNIRNFYKGWCCKGRGNKKIIVKSRSGVIEFI
ncbi:6498_t:CDS:2 [Diversispora eburnea]|uniref:6498_t:CDS:1 n=1 Tax=Diversispora eburnea TaxID=1213867 RepID=A0A9N9G0I3_9GLOM|nr:6498_t:CDS:2 [Diversispora eburnea]